MPENLVPVRRALMSVSDKSGLKEFASALVGEFKVELISTGGTAQFLRDAGLPVVDVSSVTGFPEMMDGRVKTLHPKIHGGLLALRDNPQHVAAMNQHGIQPIDLVCINLYPFAQTIARPDCTFEQAIGNIDIGGPSMIRSAAKNHRFVLVVTDPGAYEKVLGDLRKHAGSSCEKHRLKQAQTAFAHTAAYDSAIAKYLAEKIEAIPSEGKWTTGGGPARFATGPIEGKVALAVDQIPQLPENILSNLAHRLAEKTEDIAEFLTALITAQAVAIGGTEAVVFLAEEDRPEESALQLISHVRPDGANEHIRRQAIEAFRKIIAPCWEQALDGVIEVGPADDEKVQYCLVTLLRQAGKPVGATAIIAKFLEIPEAKRALGSLQFIGGYYELFAPHKTASSITLPATIHLNLKKKQDLRYGENPHQKAAIYVDWQLATGNWQLPTQLHGKELSYINLLDADAAMAAVRELETPAACVVKHATPCGYATAKDLATAFANAYAGDPLAAFGGIVALNQKVDLATAKMIVAGEKFLEVIVAPSYDADALERLKARWKNVRLLRVSKFNRHSPHPNPPPEYQGRGQGLQIHSIAGGYLVQTSDTLSIDQSNWKVASKRQPSEKEWADLKIAWLACKHVKSNAIVIARDQMMLGSGAGQQDRVSACRLAVAKAQDRATGAVAASDAFFPFPDGPALLLQAGITAIIHPGGSVRDNETLKLIDENNAAMVITGQRHFKH